MNKRLYLAGPCFSESNRASLLMLAKELEKTMHYVAKAHEQVKVFLPFRDAGDWTVVGAEAVFVRDIEAIDSCDIMVAVLDGADVDSGTAAEMGYAYAKGKPIFAYCTDIDRRKKTLNAFVSGLITRRTEQLKEGNVLEFEYSSVKKLQGAIRGYLQEKNNVVNDTERV